jgi:hypothetical protein
VKRVYFNRNNSDFGYIAAITNTKFTLYYSYADQDNEADDDDEDDEEVQDNKKSEKCPKVQLVTDKQWDVPVSKACVDNS